MIRFSFLVLGAMALSSPFVHGTNTPPMILTPKNVAEAPHQIRIDTADRGGDQYFCVTIAAKDTKVPLEVEWGYLAVYDGDKSIAGCRTHEIRGQGKVQYEFVVARPYLEKSRFSFSVATASPEKRKDMPSGRGWISYTFTLKDFVDLKTKGANPDPAVPKQKPAEKPAEQLALENASQSTGRLPLFLAYVERNGVKLGPTQEGFWQIAEPKSVANRLTVDIHVFPPLVSDKWMRSPITFGESALNAPARLGVSIWRVDSEKEWTKDMKAAAAKLLRLLKDYEPPAEVFSESKKAAKDMQALLEFFKAKGIELRRSEHESNYIQHMFSIGPDHQRKLIIGLNYLPPLTLEEAEKRYGAIPYVHHRAWAIFMVGGPGGNATDEYKAAWKKVEAAFKAYPGPGNPSVKPTAPAGDAQKNREQIAVRSTAEARNAFRSQFEVFLKKSFTEKALQYWRGRLADLDDEKKWSVRRQPFAEAWKRVDGTLTEKERKSQVVYGTLDGLRSAKGDCWAVEYFAHFDGIVGYVDARTGRLVFLWSPPEG
jgi:hypothetical protein